MQDRITGDTLKCHNNQLLYYFMGNWASTKRQDKDKNEKFIVREKGKLHATKVTIGPYSHPKQHFEKSLIFAHMVIIAHTRLVSTLHAIALKRGKSRDDKPTLWWSSGLRRLTVDAKVEGSNPDTAIISFVARYLSALATLHPGVKWVPGRMRTFMWLDEQGVRL